MEKSDHLTKQSRRLLFFIVIALCAVLLCSCGSGGEEPPDPVVKILWNQSDKEYLLPEEVVDAPSGEIRIKENGKYLNRAEWQEKEVLKSELEGLKHHES